MQLTRASRWKYFGAAMVLLLAATSPAQAPIDVRVALVVGNSAYTSAPDLLNPISDAAAMSATLKTLGFRVIELRNASRTQMEQALASLGSALAAPQAIAVFYYAGHGVQVDFRNYMVPVDAQLSNVADLPGQTVDLESCFPPPARRAASPSVCCCAAY